MTEQISQGLNELLGTLARTANFLSEYHTLNAARCKAASIEIRKSVIALSALERIIEETLSSDWSPKIHRKRLQSLKALQIEVSELRQTLNRVLSESKSVLDTPKQTDETEPSIDERLLGTVILIAVRYISEKSKSLTTWEKKLRDRPDAMARPKSDDLASTEYKVQTVSTTEQRAYAGSPESSSSYIANLKNLKKEIQSEKYFEDVAEKLVTLVQVHYATSRKVNKTEPNVEFSNERSAGQLTMGVAEVSIPSEHKIGKLERPSIWRLQFSEDPTKHVSIVTNAVSDKADWIKSALARIAETNSNSALVFVHGFNSSFDDAIRRAAQLSWDIQFDGLVTAFSWPSAASPLKYLMDTDTAKIAGHDLFEFLLRLKQDLQIHSVHIVAHSMGNVTVIEALTRLQKMVPPRAPLDEVVFAAPDIDSEVFKAAMAELHECAKRYTLYACNADLALHLSREMRSGAPRAGDGGNNITIIKGIDTVDASNVQGELLSLNHSTFASRRALLSDLFYLLRKRLPPSERHGLQEKFRNALRYWELVG